MKYYPLLFSKDEKEVAGDALKRELHRIKTEWKSYDDATKLAYKEQIEITKILLEKLK